MNQYLLLLINGWAGYNPVLDGAMLFFARYLIYFVFAAALLWFLLALYRRDFTHAVFFVVNLVIAFILLEIANHAYIEQRPFVTYHLTQLLPHAADQSFPSDHTTAASAIAFGFMLFTKFKKTGIVLFIVALVIGFSRIFTGVHYPVDIGGAVVTALMAAIIAYGFYRLYRLWRYKRGLNASKHGDPVVKNQE